MGCGASHPNDNASDCSSERGLGSRAVSYMHTVKESQSELSEVSSTGTHAREMPAITELKRSIQVLGARVAHGINEDPDQFAPDREAGLSAKRRATISQFVDDHIRAAIHTELMHQTLSDVSGMHLAQPVDKKSLSCNEDHLEGSGSVSNGLTSNCRTQIHSAISTGNETVDLDSSGLLMPQGDGLLSPSNQSPAEALHQGGEVSMLKSPPARLSSHFELPPVTLRDHIDFELLVQAADREDMRMIPIGSMLLTADDKRSSASSSEMQRSPLISFKKNNSGSLRAPRAASNYSSPTTTIEGRSSFRSPYTGGLLDVSVCSTVDTNEPSMDLSMEEPSSPLLEKLQQQSTPPSTTNAPAIVLEEPLISITITPESLRHTSDVHKNVTNDFVAKWMDADRKSASLTASWLLTGNSNETEFLLHQQRAEKARRRVESMEGRM